VIKQSNRSSDGPTPLIHAGREAHASAAPVADFGPGGSRAAERMSSAAIAHDATRAQPITIGPAPSVAIEPARRPAEDFSQATHGIPLLTVLGISLWFLGGAAIVLPALVGG
jgi:hypothetical protein